VSSRPAATADVPTSWPGAAFDETQPAAAVPPRRPTGFSEPAPTEQPAAWDTDEVDDIPEHELPWWRRPKPDA
jgi:hypothetical protein